MNIGFIGTGKIASSIIYGIFKSKLKIKKIYISSRNKNIARKLNKKFKKVEICKKNQDISDSCSTIFLAVTPSVGRKILPQIQFKKTKNIISLISTINLKSLKQITKSKNICKAIPLPPIENKLGPVIICPPNKNAKKIFSKVGKVIELNSEKISFNFWATSSLMASYYEILNVTVNWLVKKGLKEKVAKDYISELFLALSKDALIKQNLGFKKLVNDSQTPGGLNMQVLKELKKRQFYNKFIKSLNNVHKRFKISN
tara:strand:- start:279 stop:1049 length:771 start_codon:yes stop_codon:yes gene_type:complete